MAQTLLIKRDDLVTFTNMNGNIDTDKFIQYIAIAQDIHLQRVLGTDLLEALQTKVSGSTLSGNYLTLVTNWIKPALIHWAMVEFLPMQAVTVANGGIFRRDPENGTSLSSQEVDNLVNQERDFAVYYSNRLSDYLCNNMSLFPEYNSNTKEDISPSSDSNYCSWVL
jgi:hypothetical protein